MVYKGAKWISFLSISESLARWSYEQRVQSPAARTADKLGYANVMSSKSATIGGRSAYSVAASAAALPNQSGGNIGFTYE